MEGIRELQREGRLSQIEVKDLITNIRTGRTSPTTKQIYFLPYINSFIEVAKNTHNLSTNTIGTYIKNIKTWINASKLGGLHDENKYVRVSQEEHANQSRKHLFFSNVG